MQYLLQQSIRRVLVVQMKHTVSAAPSLWLSGYVRYPVME
jgi:hypothetical protein